MAKIGLKLSSQKEPKPKVITESRLSRPVLQGPRLLAGGRPAIFLCAVYAVFVSKILPSAEMAVESTSTIGI